MATSLNPGNGDHYDPLLDADGFLALVFDYWDWIVTAVVVLFVLQIVT